ncbi:hypothetical protein BBFL7_01906 [Flavobacteria bacterium BBFL7]|nr:hypothetical protein BBFL7_01906 [Flavobacteria bacterium BBFL7]
MKKIFIAVSLICCMILKVSAQAAESELNLEYEGVTLLDFEVETTDMSNEFDAIYILNKETVKFYPNAKFGQLRLVHQRIRIETEEGLKYATKQFNLYKKGNAKEYVVDLTGTTYNLLDGEIVSSELNEDAIFEKDINELYKTKSFTMPDVRVGSVIEYSYSVGSDTAYIDDLHLQYEIPILNLHAGVLFPKQFVYNVVFNPRAVYKLAFNASDFGNGISGSKITAAEDEEFGSDIETEQLRISGESIGIVTKNIPALASEPMSGGANRYRAKLIMNIAATRFSNGQVSKEYASTWNDVAKTIYDSDRFGDAIKKSNFYKKDLLSVVHDSMNQLEKTEAIYEFVKTRVKWNGRYGVFTRNGLKSAYKDGSGSVADVNLLLVSMLKNAGVNANPVLVSSDNNGVPIFPTREGFDYVIVQVVINGDKMLLDATEKFARPNLIPLRAANWKGRVILENGMSDWVKLTDNQKSQEIVLLNLSLDEEGLITGKAKKRLSQYMALRSRNANQNANQEDVEEYLVNDNVGLQVSDGKVDDMHSTNQYLNYSFDVVYKDAIDEIGDKLYITPLLFEANEENPFSLPRRNLPLDLSFPVEVKTLVNLEIPDGYEVESMPQSVNYVYLNKGYYKYITKFSNNIITTVATFNMDTSVVLSIDYKAFRDFYASVVEKDAEKIVLKKI